MKTPSATANFTSSGRASACEQIHSMSASTAWTVLDLEHRLPTSHRRRCRHRGPCEVHAEVHRDRMRNAVEADRGATRSSDALDLGPTPRAPVPLHPALERGESSALVRDG